MSAVFAAGPVNISNSVSAATFPDVWNVGSNVYVVWTEGSHGIYFTSSSNNGSSFSTPMKISTGSGQTQYPLISVNGTDVYVVWTQSVSGVL